MVHRKKDFIAIYRLSPLNELPVAVAAHNRILPVKAVIDARMAQRFVAAIATDFAGVMGDKDHFGGGWGVHDCCYTPIERP